MDKIQINNTDYTEKYIYGRYFLYNAKNELLAIASHSNYTGLYIVENKDVKTWFDSLAIKEYWRVTKC